MNEMWIAQIAAIVAVMLQLIKARLPQSWQDNKLAMPAVAVVIGILIALAHAMASMPFGLTLAWTVLLHGIVGGLVACGAYDAGLKTIFQALAGYKPPVPPVQADKPVPTGDPGMIAYLPTYKPQSPDPPVSAPQG